MYHLSDYYHGAPEKAGGDHFVVEDLLDFSNGGSEEDGGDDDEGVFSGVTVNSTESGFANATTRGGGIDGGGYCSSYLCEPCEDSAELEWLSNFVEDCFSNKLDNQKLQPTVLLPPSSVETNQLCGGGGSQYSSRPVPAKARSKRNRVAPTNWSSKIPLVISPSLSSSSSEGGRKCRHCGSDKTPQWRTGPTGPKTLCNACGVRFKSGRLVPEYRPAASPTFVVSEHSNSHRKVVEMRRQKEQQQVLLVWSDQEDKSFLMN